MTRVYVGIGSNYRREFHVHAAVSALQRNYQRVVLSSVYASDAIGGLSGEFYNLVVGFDTTDPVEEVKARLRRIEADYGRRRGGKACARITADLDLLLFGTRHGNIGGVRLPRSDIEHYAFVLGPLAEIAGGEHHPLTGESYRAMWSRFPRDTQPLRRIAWSDILERNTAETKTLRGTAAIGGRRAELAVRAPAAAQLPWSLS